MPKPTMQTPPELPRNVALRLARLAHVPHHERESFCEHVSRNLLGLWKRDRRAVSSKPGLALVRAAKAAQALQKAVYSLSQQDRAWVDNIMSSGMLQFERGKIHDLKMTIVNLAMVFSSAIGRPSPRPPMPWLPPRLRASAMIKDQRFRELVFDLLSAADEARGAFTLNKNRQTGTLLDALNILRDGDHLPKGLVPNALPIGTIQKLKANFFRLRGW